MKSTWMPLCRECVGPASLGRNAGKFKTLLTDANAVATARIGLPAVVGPDGVEIPVKFLNLDLRCYVTQQSHNITNEMHKWAREYLGEEDEPGTPSCDAIEITNLIVPHIPQMTKEKKKKKGRKTWTGAGITPRSRLWMSRR